MMPDNVREPNQLLQYNAATQQIYNPATNLCLDDQGGERLGGYNNNANVLFAACDPYNGRQKFVYVGSRLLNPNRPSNNICFNRNGKIHPGTSYYELMLWNSDSVNPDEDFKVILVCKPGTVLFQMRALCSIISTCIRILRSLRFCLILQSMSGWHILCGSWNHRILLSLSSR